MQNCILAQQAAAALEREGAVIGGRVNPWVSAGAADKALVALSMRLRISPQARLRRETTGAEGTAGERVRADRR